MSKEKQIWKLLNERTNKWMKKEKKIDKICNELRKKICFCFFLKNNAPVICIPGSIGAVESGDIAGP